MRTATLVFKITIDEELYIDRINEVCTPQDQSTVEGTDWEGIVDDVVHEMMSGYSHCQFIDGEPGEKLKDTGEEVFHISTEWVD